MIPTAISQLLEQIINAIVSVAAAYWLMRGHDASPNVDAYGAAGGTMGTLAGALAGFIFLLMVFMMYYPSFKRRVRKDRSRTRESYLEIYGLIMITIIPVIFSQTIYQVNGVLDDVMFNQIGRAHV